MRKREGKTGATALCSLARLRAVVALCALLVVAGDPVSAELSQGEFVVRSWNRKDGLPPVVIGNIQRTSNGYLWLATQRGLVRFDGARFQLFDTQNHPDLGTNHVSAVLADPGGGLWVGTPQGLFHFANARVPTDGPLEIGRSVPAYALVSGSADTLWALSSSNEVVRVSGGEIDGVFIISGAKPLRFLLSDGEGRVMAACRAGLQMPSSGQRIQAKGGGSEFPLDVVAASHRGGFWVASGTELRRLEEDGRLLELTASRGGPDAPRAPIMVLMESRPGRLWVGTLNGAIHTFNPEGGWTLVTPRRSRSLGSISSLYEDDEGVIWAGTAGGVLHQVKPRLYDTWSLPRAAQETVTQTVWVRRNGTVWVGTDGAGAYRSRDGTFQRFGAQQGLANATVLAIFEDRQENLWFGTLGGLFRLEGGRLKPELASFLQGRPVPALFQDQADDLWIGTAGAVLRKRGGEVEVFELGEAFEKSEVRAIAEGRHGEMWIGTRGGGMFRWQEGRVEKFDVFPRPQATAIHCDRDGVLWVGTRARGLFRIENDNVRAWTVSNGLPSNMIFAILEDDRGTLWLSSSEGVFGLSKEALTEYSRGKTAPLLAIHIAVSEAENWSAGSGQPAATRGPDGRLWFPMSHGVLSFQPATLMHQRPDLPVLVESVRADGVEQPLDGAGPVSVLSGVRRLEFQYTIADLDAPGKLKFRYKLEGVDEDWADGGAQRAAYYDRLPPGQYRFRVISAGSANVWSEMPDPLLVRIVPRIWETGWFRVLGSLLVIGSVGTTAHFVARARMRRKLERLEMQQAMEQERQRIARDLHDDLGSGITEIMLLTELVNQNGHETGPIRTQLSEITEKTRRLGAAMDEVVWTVNPRNDSLQNLAGYICDHAQEFFRPCPARCRIDMMEELPAAGVSAQQRHNLFMAVKEALNNAAKHSGASEVWLRFRWDDGRLSIRIEDNGTGFDPAAFPGNGSGNGLRNMKARLGAIHGTMRLSSRPGGGTKICFSMPLPMTEGLTNRHNATAGNPSIFND